MVRAAPWKSRSFCGFVNADPARGKLQTPGAGMEVFTFPRHSHPRDKSMFVSSVRELLSAFRRNSTNRQLRRSRDSRKVLPSAAEHSLVAEQLEERILLSSFAVANLNDSGNGSLRQAIINANANAGADDIVFDVSGTIQLTSAALPDITGVVDIDGTPASGSTGKPVVAIDFNGFGGLKFDAGAAGSTLNSLSLINASGDGVMLNGGGNMTISNNYIGIELDGTTAAGNLGNGIETVGSSNNTIESNIISGNSDNGISIVGGSTNVIEMNSIGTDVTGLIDVGNGENGIMLSGGTTSNLIGGEETGGNDPTNNVFVRPPEGNLISGNDGDGVLITGQATENQLSGNFIGTDASGNVALGNTLDGVAIVSANNNSLYWLHVSG